MPAPPAILALVKRFEAHADEYRSLEFNEANLCKQFVEPFFECLGWDMANRDDLSPQYRDVIYQPPLKIGETTKAPDYLFRISESPKFYVEAKKPAVGLKNDPAPAYQLRRYSWTAGLPISILTNFAEFAIYDGRKKPDQKDKASVARVLYITHTEYAEKWDEIAGIFSKSAILKGSFDKYAELTKGKRGTATVDAAFLEEIEGWREQLAKNIAARNPKIEQRELNFAVQVTIDRIIFLRMCEDRGIEPDDQLQNQLKEDDIYDGLLGLFRLADAKYNSGLFHFEKEDDRDDPDTLTPELSIDDKVLRGIIRRLYYPESPYVFKVLPADILGQVYEQFLGKVIRLTAGHQARVEDKPEVKKAGGVYYTPSYIVQYIVEQTVGKLLGEPGASATGPVLPSPLAGEGGGASPPGEGSAARAGELPPLTPPRSAATLSPKRGEGKAKTAPLRGAGEAMTPKLAAKLRVLDPACGSGSFLLGAYQYLLDWHRDWYVADGPTQHAKELAPAPGGGYRLTTNAKKQILLNNIFGVDIDPQAVEVTKLSLLLKVLEGETKESLAQTLFAKERALPDLDRNIRCGNSLIGPDFYYDATSLFENDEEERLRINVFDWHAAFPKIMKAGGFDAVIGNPPYVRQETLKEQKDYFKQRFKSFDSTADLYVYFIERAISLLRPGGYFSYIVSSGFLRTNFGRPLRNFIRESAVVLALIDFGGLPVFEAAKDTYVCIPIFTKGPQAESVTVAKVNSLDGLDLEAHVAKSHYLVPTERFSVEGWSTAREEVLVLFDKITSGCVTLGEMVRDRIFLGVKTGLNEAFEIDGSTRRKMITACPRCKEIIRPFLGGQDIRRYAIRATDQFLIAIPNGWTTQAKSKAEGRVASSSEREAWKWFSANFGPIAEHLQRYADTARQRQDQGEFWWELRPCDYYDVLAGPKIFYPDITKQPRFFLDRYGTYIRNTAYCLDSADPYLLGQLNSRLTWFAIGQISIPFGTRAGEFRYRLFTQYMAQIPLPRLDFSNPADKERHDRMVKLVERMLALHAQLAKTKTPSDRTALQARIDGADRDIDRLVYDLYGLTDEEIAIVEGASEPASA